MLVVAKTVSIQVLLDRWLNCEGSRELFLVAMRYIIVFSVVHGGPFACKFVHGGIKQRDKIV
jgi:hypothetical protein